MTECSHERTYFDEFGEKCKDCPAYIDEVAASVRMGEAEAEILANQCGVGPEPGRTA